MNKVKQIEQTIRRSPSLMEKLPEYALSRHGWYDTDGGFGVTYWSDLDEYDHSTEHLEIPEGFVSISGFERIDSGYQFLVTESEYLLHLTRVLTADRVKCDIAILDALRNSLPDIDKEISAS